MAPGVVGASVVGALPPGTGVGAGSVSEGPRGATSVGSTSSVGTGSPEAENVRAAGGLGAAVLKSAITLNKE